MSIARAIAAALLATALSACNTTPEGTPYQAAGGNFEPYGYRDRALEAGALEIRFIANKHTAREDVETGALRRAAELTLKAGPENFAVMDRIYERYVETTIERETVVGSDPNGNRQTRRNPTRRFDRERRIFILTIRPYRGEAPKGAVRTYDANSVLKQ